MPLIECVEPGVSSIRTVVTATAADVLFFPHVDSCLAIALILNNGSLIGGHVPMQMGAGGAFDPDANARRILTAMMRVRALEVGSPIAQFVTLGDSSIYDIAALLVPFNPAANHRHFDSGEYGGGFDVRLDAVQQTFTATSCTHQRLPLTVGFGALGNGVTVL